MKCQRASWVRRKVDIFAFCLGTFSSGKFRSHRWHHPTQPFPSPTRTIVMKWLHLTAPPGIFASLILDPQKGIIYFLQRTSESSSSKSLSKVREACLNLVNEVIKLAKHGNRFLPAYNGLSLLAQMLQSLLYLLLTLVLRSIAARQSPVSNSPRLSQSQTYCGSSSLHWMPKPFVWEKRAVCTFTPTHTNSQNRTHSLTNRYLSEYTVSKASTSGTYSFFFFSSFAHSTSKSLDTSHTRHLLRVLSRAHAR